VKGIRYVSSIRANRRTYRTGEITLYYDSFYNENLKCKIINIIIAEHGKYVTARNEYFENITIELRNLR